MRRPCFAGLLVLFTGLFMTACSFSGLLLGFPIGLAVNALPLLVGTWMLLRRSESSLASDFSIALTGCLLGVLLGIALTSGFLKLLTSGKAHPYDEAAYGILFALSLMLAVTVWIIDLTRNLAHFSLRRLVLQGIITASLVLPSVLPAAKTMAFFEGILSKFVS